MVSSASASVDKDQLSVNGLSDVLVLLAGTPREGAVGTWLATVNSCWLDIFKFPTESLAYQNHVMLSCAV